MPSDADKPESARDAVERLERENESLREKLQLAKERLAAKQRAVDTQTADAPGGSGMASGFAAGVVLAVVAAWLFIQWFAAGLHEGLGRNL
jgi:hypothetical protein